MQTYLIISSIIWTMLAFVWKRDDWLHFFLKAVFLGMTVWSFVLTFSTLGFIVKV